MLLKLVKPEIHGGKAKNDKIDAHKIAGLLRGGMLPQASGYPAEMRATRDLLRPRMPLRRQRAARLSPLHNTTSQSTLSEIGKKRASKANRDGVAERFPDPAGQKRIAVALALLDHDDPLLSDLELSSVPTARQHDPNTLYRLQTVPGMGKMLRLVLRYVIHHSQRFPRVQDCGSSCRLVKCAKASAGTRYGTSGKKRGPASLTWALSEAAVLFLRHKAQGQKCLARVEKKHGQGKACTIVAHKLARAVYDMLTRDTGGAMDTGLNGYGSRAGEHAAALDTPGSSLHSRPWTISQALRHETRQRPSAFFPDPSRVLGHPLWLLDIGGESAKVDVGCPSPAPAPHWRPPPVQPLFGLGRYEGTAKLLGRRGLRGRFSASTMTMVTAPQEMFGADTFGLLLRWQ